MMRTKLASTFHPTPLKPILMAKCIDHAFSVAFGAVLFGLVQWQFLSWQVESIGFGFFVGFLGAFAVGALVIRAFFIALIGRTLGQHIVGLWPLDRHSQRSFWSAHVLESLEPLVPALLLVDLALRLSDSQFWGLRYNVEVHEHA